MKRNIIKSNIKKTVILLIILAVIIPQICGLCVNAANSHETWDISKNGDKSVQATLDTSSKILHISGKGEMKDWDVERGDMPEWAKNYLNLIEYIEIGEGVTNIGKGAFDGCSKVQSIDLPSTVTKIGAYAFSSCGELKRIEIPSSVQSIDTKSFYHDENLVIHCEKESYAESYAKNNIIAYNYFDEEAKETWQIGLNESDTVKATLYFSTKTLAIHGEGEMRGWDVERGDMPEWINDYSIIDWIEKIEIENGVTNIGKGAFNGCSKVKSIVLSDTITEIGDYAFSSCNELKSITIPSSVESIGFHAFWGNNENLIIYCEKGSYAESYAKENNIAYNNGETATKVWNISKDTQQSVYAILDYNAKTLTIKGEGEMKSFSESEKSPWFNQVENIESVIIEEGITKIGDYAFEECSNLESIDIPSSMTSSLGYCVFSKCSKLKSIEIPEGVTSIGPSAFQSCSSLTSIEIPGSVTSIADNAFSRCDNLTIYGNLGSYAETYANERNIRFIAINEINPETITLDKSSVELDLNGTKEVKLNATIEPSDANINTGLTWTSENDTIATVDKDGNVTAVGEGECTITVETENAKKATCRVTVIDNSEPDTEEINPERVKLDKSSVELDLNGTKEVKLNATIEPSDANINTGLTWTSEDDTIATVDKTGKITAKKTGTCTITVETENGKKATCRVTVVDNSKPDTEEINPERVKLDKSSVELDLNGTKEVKLNATIEPSDANINTGLTWTSEDDTIATVDKTGKITANKTGTCTITVKTANGKTATCQVTVINSMNNQNNSGNGNGQNNSGSGSGSSNGGNVGSSGSIGNSGSTQKNNSGKTTENISNTLSSTVLPKTGYQVGLLIGIITLVVVAIICYKKSKIY